jgi:hypothetical protein
MEHHHLRRGAAARVRPSEPVESYRCEWKAAIEDPDKLRLFRPFVNTQETDPSLVYIGQRGQHRPATWEEKQLRVAGGVRP